MKNKTILKGALVLVVCNLLGKAIGAVFRIPLARILGSQGMGEYQLIFPLYCLILTVSSSGVPVAISKLVAEFNAEQKFKDSKRILWFSVAFLICVSTIGTLIVIFGAKAISNLQGNPNNYFSYYAIAPAIIFASVMSAFRGYFQGNLQMFPTAISGIIEQVIKVVLGLYFASKFINYSVESAVFGALLGISISEFFALLFLCLCYFFASKKKNFVGSREKTNFKILSKRLVSLAVPITFGGLISPITAMIDSFLVVNILILIGYSSDVATMMLGLESGVAEPLINLPVMIAVSIGVVILPSLSSMQAEKNESQIKALIEKSYEVILSISVASAVCFVIFGKQILGFLYGGSFDQNELMLALKLLIAGSLNIIFLSFVHITTSILQAVGHEKYAVKSLAVGCGIKILLNILLLRIPSINILGSVIADSVCYFIIMILNYKKVHSLTNSSLKVPVFYISLQSAFIALFAYFSNEIFKILFSDNIALILAGAISVMIFAVTYYAFFLSGEKNKDLNKKII